MKAICTGCGQLIELKDIPPAKVFNDPAMSIVVSRHEELGFCLTCKTKDMAPPVYADMSAATALSLQNVALTYVARPVTPPSPIVLAPASALDRFNKAFPDELQGK